MYLYELQKQAEQRAFGELFRPVSQRVQMNFIFNENVRILCLSCNVNKVVKLVRFRQKGQKQASFLAFHKCCQGCLLRGPRYISTSFILVCALRCTQLHGTRKVYSQAEKFVRLVRIKQTFIRIAYLNSKCTDCRINHYQWYPLVQVQAGRCDQKSQLSLNYLLNRYHLYSGIKGPFNHMFMMLPLLNF